MRYSEGYFEWAAAADGRMSPDDRDRASTTAAKIRDNLSSSFDREQMERMERVARGGSGRADRDDDGPRPRPAVPPRRIPRRSRTLAFHFEGRDILIDALPGRLTPAMLEETISCLLGTRPDFEDIDILGYEGTSTLSKAGRFRARLKVGDHDPESEGTVNDRVVAIDGTVHETVWHGEPEKPARGGRGTAAGRRRP